MKHVLLASLFLATSCGPFEEGVDDVDPIVHEESAEDGKADGPTIRYTLVPNAFLPTLKVQTEALKIFKTAASFKSYFAVDAQGFDYSKTWLVFYTPGTATPALKNLRGWKATVT